MADTCRILLVSGSLRAASTNTALLRTARAVAPPGVEAVLYDGLGTLPWFNPDDDPPGGPVHPAVAGLRAQIAESDAVLFCTPEYAGALPGSFKNLLDWTVGGGETYGMPVGWVNVSGPASPTGAAGAHDSLRAVLTYTGTDIVATSSRPGRRRVRLGLDVGCLDADGAATALAAHQRSRCTALAWRQAVGAGRGPTASPRRPALARTASSSAQRLPAAPLRVDTRRRRPGRRPANLAHADAWFCLTTVPATSLTRSMIGRHGKRALLGKSTLTSSLP